MKVIFLKDVPQVAKRHDIKDVSDGYARNFLFPKKIAELATSSALLQFAAKEDRRAMAGAKEEGLYKSIAEKLKNTPLVFKLKVGEKGTAFGSVSAAKIAEALKGAHIKIDKEWIKMEEHIKTTGDHTVSIKFPRGIMGEIHIVVEAE